MANSEADGLGFAIEEMRAEHVENVGRALYTAFYMHSCTTSIPSIYIIASLEAENTFLDSISA